MESTTRQDPPRTLSVAGLFAGIGGLEQGLKASGHLTELLCEIDVGCQAVLRRHFPDVRVHGDIRALKKIPAVDLVTAGFPCTDLSQAGRTAGIRGSQSGLVGQVFRLLDSVRTAPSWLLLENVPFMLQLDRGRAMHFLIESLEQRGYRWAYRVVDSRAFGLPQRRRRVIFLASQTEDPRSVLFADDARYLTEPADPQSFGFYWTEGLRGLGWAHEAIPTLKAGSSVGIPSPPAILLPNGEIRTPDIRDAERLQGFPKDWTLPAVQDAGTRQGARWRLVGNAVSVPVAKWVGNRLRVPGAYSHMENEIVQQGEPWPRAAWGSEGKVYRAEVSEFPKAYRRLPLTSFLRFEGKLLSVRATSGFLARAERSSLRFPPGFIDQVRAHLRSQQRPLNS